MALGKLYIVHLTQSRMFSFPRFPVLTKQAKHIVTTDLFLSFQILLINYKALQYDVIIYKTDFLYIVGFWGLNFIILTSSVICSETVLDADVLISIFRKYVGAWGQKIQLVENVILSKYKLNMFIFICMYVYVCICVHVIAGVLRGWKRTSDSWSWNYRGCESPDVSTGNQTWVL